MRNLLRDVRRVGATPRTELRLEKINEKLTIKIAKNLERYEKALGGAPAGAPMDEAPVMRNVSGGGGAMHPMQAASGSEGREIGERILSLIRDL